MAIIKKKVNGHGPYLYKVTYENGQHHWTYLGRADGDDALTNDDQNTSREDSQTVELGEGAVPLRTALNAALDDEQALGTDLDRNELERLDDAHTTGSNDEIPTELQDTAIELLQQYEAEKAQSEGEPTIHDPNAEDETLEQTREGIRQLGGDISDHSDPRGNASPSEVGAWSLTSSGGSDLAAWEHDDGFFDAQLLVSQRDDGFAVRAASRDLLKAEDLDTFDSVEEAVEYAEEFARAHPDGYEPQPD